MQCPLSVGEGTLGAAVVGVAADPSAGPSQWKWSPWATHPVDSAGGYSPFAALVEAATVGVPVAVEAAPGAGSLAAAQDHAPLTGVSAAPAWKTRVRVWYHKPKRRRTPITHRLDIR